MCQFENEENTTLNLKLFNFERYCHFEWFYCSDSGDKIVSRSNEERGLDTNFNSDWNSLDLTRKKNIENINKTIWKCDDVMIRGGWVIVTQEQLYRSQRWYGNLKMWWFEDVAMNINFKCARKNNFKPWIWKQETGDKNQENHVILIGVIARFR